MLAKLLLKPQENIIIYALVEISLLMFPFKICEIYEIPQQTSFLEESTKGFYFIKYNFEGLCMKLAL